MGWRTWHVDTNNMSATRLPGSSVPGSSHPRDAAAGSGMLWTAQTVSRGYTREPFLQVMPSSPVDETKTGYELKTSTPSVT
jgi:hypothetical protein